MELKHGNLTQIYNQKLMSMEMDFLSSARCSRLEKKIRNNVVRARMNIKNSVLESLTKLVVHYSFMH